MIKLLKEHNRFNETLFLGTLTLICLLLTAFRFFYTGKEISFSLKWNLFLAFIPYALSSFISIHSKKKPKNLILFTLLFFWLLFFPNAPYILTDLIHLQYKTNMPIWFDLILILSFAWTGLLFGLLSLWDIEKLLRKSFQKKWVNSVIIILLFIGSFGIYLGRFLRWNSWDIFKNPFRLFYDISITLLDPSEFPRAWGLTFFLGIFLNMLYWSFRFVHKRKE